ncbi:Type III pantothenate kinase [Pseudomonas fluorescens]|jgi:type III pantothenate kinase|uniref:Type III pantothenate kinase n=1 Tax=Pseudomonas fluorescens TaxID=294 RepID=A0A5E7U5L2_PSEFL|nr:pantothenate kinase [Pseudomonas fluorescens]PYC13854.1 pantothenate kinase [Pseudomonas jessenii]VVQ05675.1 Type III pantothenate kinase [Pseudomonas fluorescens]
MILELDCGNSFIKWRVLRASLDALFSEGVVDSDLALLDSLRALDGLVLRKCRVVSVRTVEETDALIDAIEREFGISVVCAKPAREMSGVKNGYENYERLGLDRWLAMLGGFHLASGGACLVLDFGTAVTADFIAADGEHLGGFICPGMPLMRNQLRTHTRNIRYGDLAAERALSSSAPGRSTVEAVERGCLLMLRGFVLTQLELARSYWGEDFTVFITGGDAELVAGVSPEARVVPDLVFVGLAMACPFS